MLICAQQGKKHFTQIFGFCHKRVLTTRGWRAGGGGWAMGKMVVLEGQQGPRVSESKQGGEALPSSVFVV